MAEKHSDEAADKKLIKKELGKKMKSSRGCKR